MIPGNLQFFRKVLQLAAVAITTAMPLPSSGQGIADPERGRALYENHCVVCHTPRVHSRPNKAPVSRDELREIVERWQQAERLRWSAQDVADVVEFLGRTRYGYASQ
jgi:mono/diheme cytochrome c family protein